MKCDQQRPFGATLFLLFLVAFGGLSINPVAAQAPSLRPQVIASGLEHPWAVAFIGGGQMLVTERPGRLRLITPEGRVSQPLAGLPEIDANRQGGLLDLITDRDFARNRMLYFCFAEPAAQGSGNSTALASARLSDNASALEKVTVIFRQQPKVISQAHFGCRIVEANDGTLFLTLGDRYSRMADAQTLDNHHGKVIRIHKDGRVPADNPFVNQAGARPEIWSYGHRNSQGAALGPDGHLWTHEHGPQGGDELNRPAAGKNYGWPVITYGKDYGDWRRPERKKRDGATAAFLGALDCTLGDGIRPQRALWQKLARQPAARLAEIRLSGATGNRRPACRTGRKTTAKNWARDS